MSSATFTGPSIEKLLDDSERMLAYAASAGKQIEPDIPETIAVAREALGLGKLTTSLHGRLYCVQSRLAHAIRPVSAETLDPNSMEEARKAARYYFRLAFFMAALIVPASMVMFVNSKLSASGKALVEANDQIALPLHDALEAQRNAILSIERPGGTYASPGIPMLRVKSSAQALGAQGVLPVAEERPEIDSVQALTPSALAIKEKLQVFARNNRQLYAETIWLERLSLHGSENPYRSPWMSRAETQRENLELTLPILVRRNQSGDGSKDDQNAHGPEHSVDDGLQKLAVYQDIRAMAQNAQHTSDFLWSSIAVYVLPVLYAVLGTLAFILRDLCARTRTQTYHASQARFANGARIIVAVIVGTVIGLFDKFMDGSISPSPLAIAFVAGYAVDPFFAFIDHVASAGRTSLASSNMAK